MPTVTSRLTHRDGHDNAARRHSIAGRAGPYSPHLRAVPCSLWPRATVPLASVLLALTSQRTQLPTTPSRVSPPILQPRYLGHNKLKAVPNNIFNGLTNLLTLELTHNELGNFQGTLLSTNLRLENLHLANNELTSFSTTILTPLKWIKLLNLESNNFNTVPASTYSALNRLEAEYKQTRVCDVGTWQNYRYLKNR